MPITAWIDERHLPPLGLSNAWGYNPVAYLAPDPRLCPGGIAELRATVDALQQLEEPEAVAARRGLSVEQVAPAALLRAQAEGRAAARAEKVGS